MGLPAGERRKLRAMERAQATADPGLAARFSMFNQLSSHEEMPRTERLNARAVRRGKRAERAIITYLISGQDMLLRADGGSGREHVHPAAVDVEDRAVHEGGIVGSQVDRRRRDGLRVTGPARRGPVHHHRGGMPVDGTVGVGDDAGGHRVDPNPWGPNSAAQARVSVSIAPLVEA